MDVADARQAAKAARTFLTDLQPEPEMADFRIEDIELTDDGLEWWVTLSYRRKRPDEDRAVPSMLFGIEKDRAYKRVGIRASDGSIIGMKIRELAVG
jgi:hypothetical protein